VVEFALLAPILVFLVMAIVDLARVYTTSIDVESAAREAADYGTFGSQKWNPALYALPTTGTEAKMRLRACVAASKLPDYVGPDDSCTNPVVTYDLSPDRGATWGPYDAGMGCDTATREPPCWLRVTVHYDFRLIAPFHFDFFGVGLGLPVSIPIERSSVFPMTDLSLP
jgi:TadE-like protein